MNFSKNPKDIQEDEELVEDTKTCVIMPDDKYKRRWNLWIGLLLLYTGIFVPLRVAFYDKASTGVIVMETIVDICFFVDIVLTFFTAFEKHKNIEVRHK